MHRAALLASRPPCHAAMLTCGHTPHFRGSRIMPVACMGPLGGKAAASCLVTTCQWPLPLSVRRRRQPPAKLDTCQSPQRRRLAGQQVRPGQFYYSAEVQDHESHKAAWATRR
jgi:hypothetical protein